MIMLGTVIIEIEIMRNCFICFNFGIIDTKKL